MNRRLAPPDVALAFAEGRSPSRRRSSSQPSLLGLSAVDNLGSRSSSQPSLPGLSAVDNLDRRSDSPSPGKGRTGAPNRASAYAAAPAVSMRVKHTGSSSADHLFEPSPGRDSLASAQRRPAASSPRAAVPRSEGRQVFAPVEAPRPVLRTPRTEIARSALARAQAPRTVGSVRPAAPVARSAESVRPTAPAARADSVGSLGSLGPAARSPSAAVAPRRGARPGATTSAISGALALETFAFEIDSNPAPTRSLDSRRDNSRARLRSVVDRPSAKPMRVARRAIGIVVFVVVLLLLFGIALQAQLASRQIVLDRLNAEIATAEDGYQRLRAHVAILESPERVRTEAERLGLVPATSVEFLPVDEPLPAGG